MASNRLVWYVLVDAQGETHQGTRASSVNIPSDNVIDQFAKVVHAKNPRKPSSFDASDLLVYANKAAFDRKDEPLEEDSTIGTFGSSKKEAFIVVVPEEDQSSKASQVTITIKESDDEAYLNELSYYQQRGKLIQDNCKGDCDAILKKVEDFYALTDLPLPFICVEGSSGMGKSQLAFALYGERPYFYWLVTPIGEDSQKVYQNFTSISSNFDYFVQQDDPTTKLEDEILNSESLIYEARELWTYGFIHALLNNCNSGDLVNGSMIRFVNEASLDVAKCKLQDVRKTIADMKLKNKKLPFFILDEMPPNMNVNSGGKNKAAFQRNVFRVCSLVVFVMGTDSKVTNLIAQAMGSYAEEHFWMAIVPRFPPYQFVLDVPEKQVWDDVIGRYPVIEYIVKKSRGRFARHFTEQVLQIVMKQPIVKLCELLDKAFAAVYQRILVRKKNFDGKCAQLMAISFTNVQQSTSV